VPQPWLAASALHAQNNEPLSRARFTLLPSDFWDARSRILSESVNNVRRREDWRLTAFLASWTCRFSARLRRVRSVDMVFSCKTWLGEPPCALEEECRISLPYSRYYTVFLHYGKPSLTLHEARQSLEQEMSCDLESNGPQVSREATEQLVSNLVIVRTM
jgi:hypothetical protein